MPTARPDPKLSEYVRKRRIGVTPEPDGSKADQRDTTSRRRAAARALSFVVQKHHASHLHYDFRLELDGTLKSWAIPKGPSLDPAIKRLAVHVEDHPLSYANFEGSIPAGHYGAGEVIVWDRGSWTPAGADPVADYRAGKLKFTLRGAKLNGGYMLVRSAMGRQSGRDNQWLLIKERDEEARAETELNITEALPDSVLSDIAQPSRKRDMRSTRSAKSQKSAAQTGQRPDSHGALDELPDEALDGAVVAPLPTLMEPQLATLVTAIPDSDAWSYELKLDGYRLLARIDRSQTRAADRIRLLTRNGHDWTERFPAQVRALTALDLKSAWLDGEAVVLDTQGVPHFQALQNALDNAPETIVLYVFDAPYLNGVDLRQVALSRRRALLAATLAPAADDALRFSADLEPDPAAVLRASCAAHLEGLIGKRRDSHYVSGRSSTWIKLKCRQRQEFVVGGYTDPAGSRTHFGALLLGVYDEHGDLHYAGRVGTGFDARGLHQLKQQLDASASRKMPFTQSPVQRGAGVIYWLTPQWVAEVEFGEWTSSGLIRQASFIGLRDDKPARAVVRERAAPLAGGGNKDSAGSAPDEVPTTATRFAGATVGKAKAGVSKRPAMGKANAKVKVEAKVKAEANAKPKTKPPKGAAEAELMPLVLASKVRITHPSRLIDPESGISKAALLNYYASVSEWLLPHLAQRPVALLRAMDGLAGEQFFQKHAGRLNLPGIAQHADLDPGHPPLLTIDNLAGLLGAVQMGSVELHTWNGQISQLERPDRLILDLDPDPNLPWSRITEAAFLVRTLLDEIGLRSFIKTSGGKGLHVVVPLSRHAGWEQVKDFSQAIARHLATILPQQFTATSGPKNRIGKIFTDYLRNSRGAATVCAYSARARPGMGVSVPVEWHELQQIESANQWTVETLGQRLLKLKVDPWHAYAGTRQRITAAMKRKLGMA
jgi:bifunctional non-homologous end joining protein LigD